MATGKCPSCQTPVSDTATTCPHCGYRDDKSGTSIISSPRTPAHPAWHTTAVPSDPDRRLIDILTSTSRIQLAEELLQAAPAFAEAVRSLLPETVKIAHIPDEMQHLINNGQLAFRFDKNGEMLAQLTKGDGLVSNNLRLRNLTLTPEFGLSIVNLQMQLTMMQVVSELHDVKQGIDELRAGLHDDRLATVDSAKQQFSQAMSISGARLREMKFLDVLERTTDAKCQLMRTFERDYAELEKQRSQSPLARMMDQNASKKGDTNSIEMLKSLAAIVEASRIGDHLLHPPEGKRSGTGQHSAAERICRDEQPSRPKHSSPHQLIRPNQSRDMDQFFPRRPDLYEVPRDHKPDLPPSTRSIDQEYGRL